MANKANGTATEQPATSDGSRHLAAARRALDSRSTTYREPVSLDLRLFTGVVETPNYRSTARHLDHWRDSSSAVADTALGAFAPVDADGTVRADSSVLDLSDPALTRTVRRVPDLPIRLWPFPIILVVVAAAARSITRPGPGAFNDYLSVVWTMYLPIALVGLIGAVVTALRSGNRIELSTSEVVVGEKVIIQIPTLCHPGNLPALTRVIRSILEHAGRNLVNYRIDVVIDEGDAAVVAATAQLRDCAAGDPRIRLVVVPNSYRTPLGAKFKTRANQYAMERRRDEGDNTTHCYVYHLDDDTSVGADTISSIAEFIAENRDGTHLIAQGILAFPRELSPSRFSNLADSVRPADDATRFKFFTDVLGTPLGGLHGEHLLARADIEDEIGWDFPDTVIEDAFFAIRFAGLYPGRSTALKSLSYGESPASVKDLVKQRRRWTEGLLRLIVKRGIPLRLRLPLTYSVICWALAPIQFVGLIIPLGWLLHTHGASPEAWWVGLLWSFNLSFLLWQYVLGFRINNRASARPAPAWHAVALVPLMFVFAAVESYAALLGVLRFVGVLQGQKVSEVINKPR